MRNRPLVTAYKTLKRRVEARRDRYRRFIRRAKKTPIPVAPFIRLSHAIAQQIDCRTCANCCRSMTVQLNGNDVKRLANHIQISVPEFKRTYLRYNKSDKLYEMKSKPCPFLSKDNLCTVYELRPRNCRGYPFLHERQPLDYRLNWLVEHAAECPIIYNTLEKTIDQVEEK